MSSPLHEVVLVVRSFGRSSRALRPHLDRIDQELGAALVEVDGYLRRSSDLAMFLCRLDLRQLTELDPLAQLAERMQQAGGELIDLAAMAPEQRRKLCQQILPRCEVSCRATRGVAIAAESLGAAATSAQAIAPAPSDPAGRVPAATRPDAATRTGPTTAPLPARRAGASSAPPPMTARAGGSAPPPSATGPLRAQATDLSREPPPRVRFQRGESWHVGRLGSVMDDRLYIITSAPLRVGERTHIELAAPSVSARLPAVVIDDPDIAEPGTWGFSVRLLVDGPRRLSDQNVLTWARNRLAGARAMPSRGEHRIPLAWPARLRDGSGEHAITMRDVSRGGVFAEMPRMPEGSVVQLRVPFDLGDAPLELEAVVARVVDRELAAKHGVPSGVGLRVRPVARDSDRYPAFVERVTQRAARHVLIGARKPKLDDLVRHFTSCGYLATGYDDVRALCAGAASGGRMPEVVLVDRGLTTPDQIRPRLGRKDLAVIAIEGSGIDARRLVDAALLS